MLAMLGENSPREALLRSIDTQAELLGQEPARFIDYSVAFKIVNFLETSPTQKLKQVRMAGAVRSRANGRVGRGWEVV